jgi:hypothetical protein
VGSVLGRAIHLKIVFFAPHSAVWIHAFPEALVAESLKQAGHEIIYVGCGGTLESHCVAMSAYSVPFEAPASAKHRVCAACRRNRDILRARIGLTGPDLEGLATAADWAAAEEAIRALSAAELVELTLEGIHVGRIALYEMLIQRKRGALDLTAQESLRFQSSLRNVIVVLRVMGRMLDELKPDRVVLYNALYSVNRAVCLLAQRRGIPQYYLHAGDNLSNRLGTLVLARDHAFAYCWHLRSQWPRFKDRPCPPEAMRAGTNHLLEVARGRSVWAYSAAAGASMDLEQTFGVAPGQRVICATMSSDDERFGGEVVGVLPSLEGRLFPKQIDWIRALTEYVEPRSDLLLIIRVHPREFPNKREQVLSDHAVMMQEAFARLPDNVRVNWPTQNVSLYDLAGITDVFVSAWSSAGKEMAWLGMPVVLYDDDLALYPADLNYVGMTTPDYFRCIEQALLDGWSADRIRKGYRWCAVELYYSTLDISESFAKNENAPLPSKLASGLMRAVAPGIEQHWDAFRRARRLTAGAAVNRIIDAQLKSAVDIDYPGPPITFAEETENLKHEVGRLADGLFGPEGRGRRNVLASRLRSFAKS